MLLEKAWPRLVLTTLLVALGAVAWATMGIPLGLDLKGGTRLVYRVDVDQIKTENAEQSAGSPFDPKQELQNVVTVIAQRIDPQGVKDPSITVAGSENIVIELPGGDVNEANRIQARIEDLGQLEMRMKAYDDYRQDIKGKPLDDGDTFNLGEEQTRLQKWLEKQETKDAIARDPVAAIRRYNSQAGTDNGPKSKMLNWAPMYYKTVDIDGKKTRVWQRHPDMFPAADSATVQIPAIDGSNKKEIWFTTSRWMPLNMHEVHFTGEDLDAKGVMVGQNPDTGSPAVDYRIAPGRSADYGELSETHTKKVKAVLLNGVVRVAPHFVGTIFERGQISGGFSAKEVEDLVITLKTGSLKIVPDLESKTQIGASLGAAAIEKGLTSIIVGGLLILLFMAIYYRMTGFVAILALMVNVGLIGGIMALIRGTLTLPGLAGIVLTIGMAVDANILIFERIREEKDRGKDLLRAIEAGFEKAMSTILDANITTFLTGLILYNVGIGPIRGFAVTLMLGIVCSVFSAVFVGKMLYHYLLASGALKEKLGMMRLFATPTFRLLSYRKVTAVISAVLIIGGLTSFFSVHPNDKYGLDFTGGGAFQVALSEKSSQKDVTDTLKRDGEFNKQFPSPQVTSVGEGDTQYLIKLKLTPDQRAAYEAKQAEAKKKGETYAPPYIDMVRRIFAGKLAHEPFSDIKAALIEEGGQSTAYASAIMHSNRPVKLAELRAELAKSAIKINSIQPVINGKPQEAGDIAEAKDIKIEFVDPPYKNQENYLKAFPVEMRERLDKLKTADKQPLVLSSPFPESSLISSRAVGELRSAAIGAIILSLLIIVLYIRVRFHEYKYGFGACAALIHDVIITLGIVVGLNKLGIIHAEIDLAMIAAFLTIIGYSLNDTIVVFDRIRENVGIQEKLGTKDSFEELVDKSVNQTLSRTVLTSLTTFLVLTALFIFNYGAGSTLEGFAFSMMIGVIVGTYSSIWVANPVVVWMTKREKPTGGPSEASVKPKAA